MSQADLSQLRQLLVGHLSKEELRTLCFDLGVEYDDLPGEGRAAKARDLVAHLDRRGRLPELLQAGARLRPDVPWTGAQAPASDSSSPAPPDRATPPIPPPASGRNRVWEGLLMLATVAIVAVVWIVRLSIPTEGHTPTPDWIESIWFPLIVTVVGGVAILIIEYRTKWFARWQADQEADQHPSKSKGTPKGIRENVQIGHSIIRVLKGTRVFRNLQIGRSRIEVTDRDTSTEE